MIKSNEDLKIAIDLTELVELYSKALVSGDDKTIELATVAVAEAAAAEASTIEMLAYEAMAQRRLD